MTPRPTLHLNTVAADAVMRCGGMGLRAYAIAGGLDPATDFRGLDLRGWDLAGQDLRGFDLSGCDLRDTSVEHARTDGTSILKGAILNEGVQAGSAPLAGWDDATLMALHSWAERLHNEDRTLLSVLGDEVLGAIQVQFGATHPMVLQIARWVGHTEAEDADPTMFPHEDKWISSNAPDSSINIDPRRNQTQVVERGVWHPAFLEVIGRQLHVDLHVAQNFTEAREVLLRQRGISYVYAATIRGEHDFMIRRYASPAEEGVHDQEPLPRPCSSLTANEFWELFKRDRKWKFVADPRDVIKYRTLEVKQDDWEEKKQAIARLLPEVLNDADRKRRLRAIWRLATDWHHSEVSASDREEVALVFFSSPENMVPLDPDRGSNLRETYVLIAVLTDYSDVVRRFEREVVRGLLVNRSEIRSIYRIRSAETAESRFNFLLDIIATPTDADKIVINLRTWAEAAGITLGTRSFDVMEYLQSKAVEGLVAANWSKHIRPFVDAMQRCDPNARRLLLQDYLADPAEQLRVCAESWFDQVSVTYESQHGCQDFITDFYVNLYLGNFYPVAHRTRSLRAAGDAWLHLYQLLENASEKVLEEHFGANGLQLEARLQQHFEGKMRPEVWTRTRTDRFALVLHLWEEERSQDREFLTTLRGIRRDYHEVVQKGFRNLVAHGNPDAHRELLDIHGDTWKQNMANIESATRILIGFIERVTEQPDRA